AQFQFDGSQRFERIDAELAQLGAKVPQGVDGCNLGRFAHAADRPLFALRFISPKGERGTLACASGCDGATAIAAADTLRSAPLCAAKTGFDAWRLRRND